MRILPITLILSCFLLASCAGTAVKVGKPYQPTEDKLSYKIIKEDPVPEKALKIFRTRLDSELASHNLLAKGQSNRVVEIRITNYYMRHGAARALVGVMAGRDQILSTVRVKGSRGKVLAEFEVISKNPTGWGSAGELIEDHADKIVEHLTSSKS